MGEPQAHPNAQQPVETQIFAEKEIIFREGTPGDKAYIIRSGQVEILKSAEHGDIQLAILGEGEVLGEMALFEAQHPRSASARALSQVHAEIISGDALEEMLQKVPAAKSIMMAVMRRLRDTNSRLAARERATVVLDAHIDKITIRPADDTFNFEPISMMAANLPFTIGGYLKSEENPQQNNLDLPSDGPPLVISQKHMTIERKGNEVFAVDNGSRFCSIVNKKVIGRGKIDTRAQLKLGDNTITFGDYTSPYKLILTCE